MIRSFNIYIHTYENNIDVSLYMMHSIGQTQPTILSSLFQQYLCYGLGGIWMNPFSTHWAILLLLLLSATISTVVLQLGNTSQYLNYYDEPYF